MKLWESIKNIFAGRPKNSPEPVTVPNDLFNWYANIANQKNKQYKNILPRNPSIEQLRNFAKNAIIRRPINYIEDTICNLKYQLVNVDINDETDYAVQKLIAINTVEQPNIIHSRKQLFRMVLEDLVVLDSGACEKAIGGNPLRPLYLYPTDGSTLQYVIPYNYTDENAALYAQRQYDGIKYFTAKQIAYLKRNHFTDRPQGLSPVLAAYNYIVYLLNSNERADGVASNATADFLINLGEGVTDTIRQEFIKYMEEEIQGTGTIPVTAGNNNVDTKQIRAINKDGLYLEWQQFLMGVIAIAFPFPKEKMGITSSNDISTAADLDSIMVNELIKPYASIIEDFVNLDILKTLGYDKLFKFSFVYEETETQKTSKSARLTKEMIAGGLSENEFRLQMGYKQSSSRYADMTTSEKTATINKDIPSNNGGFNGSGDKKNNYQDVPTDNKMK
jgi:phage portal protein BeeE